MYLHKNLLVSEKERVDLVENNSRNAELSKSLEKGGFTKGSKLFREIQKWLEKCHLEKWLESKD